jgi:hypothetical protein
MRQVVTLYEDERITCLDDALVIDTYYFPFGEKRVPYASIRAVHERDMGPGIWRGRWRIWGSGDLRHWYHYDPHRPDKRTALVLDLGGWIRPVITPDDPSLVRGIFEGHGIPITTEGTAT